MVLEEDRRTAAGRVTFGCMVNGAVHGRHGEYVEHVALRQEPAIKWDRTF